MNEQTLRAWVRGELSAPERRDVTRWIIRCSDPQLPAVLEGLAVEARESSAERAWSELTEAFYRLLDQGRAFLQGAHLGPVVLASADERPSEPVVLLPDGDQHITIQHPPGTRLVLSQPDGDVARIPERIPTPAAGSVVWAIAAETPVAQDAHDDLRGALADVLHPPYAARWVVED